MAVLAPPRADVAALHGPNPGLDVQLSRERLRRVLVLRDVRQESAGVEEHRVPADRLDDRDARLQEALAQVADLADAVRQVVIVNGLPQPDRHRLQVAPGQAAVAGHALEHHDQLAGRRQDLLVPHRQEATDVDQAVLLARHSQPIEVAQLLLDDLGAGLLGVPLLPLLDEEGVLGQAGRVRPHDDLVVVADLADRADVLHRDRLATGQVHGQRDVDVGDLVGAHLIDQRLELGDVDIALERVLGARVVRLVDDDVVEGGAGHLLVQAGGGEVHVAGHVHSGADQDAADQVFGAAALVGRHDIGEAVDLAHRVVQHIEGLGAGIGLVADHHVRPLVVAHRGGARVGEQVDVAQLARQQEGVVARLPDRHLALLARRHGERLDGLNPERLGKFALGGRHGWPPRNGSADGSYAAVGSCEP